MWTLFSFYGEKICFSLALSVLLRLSCSPQNPEFLFSVRVTASASAGSVSRVYLGQVATKSEVFCLSSSLLCSFCHPSPFRPPAHFACLGFHATRWGFDPHRFLRGPCARASRSPMCLWPPPRLSPFPTHREERWQNFAFPALLWIPSSCHRPASDFPEAFPARGLHLHVRTFGPSAWSATLSGFLFVCAFVSLFVCPLLSSLAVSFYHWDWSLQSSRWLGCPLLFCVHVASRLRQLGYRIQFLWLPLLCSSSRPYLRSFTGLLLSHRIKDSEFFYFFLPCSCDGFLITYVWCSMKCTWVSKKSFWSIFCCCNFACVYAFTNSWFRCDSSSLTRFQGQIAVQWLCGLGRVIRETCWIYFRT
jgi:hypothetical protein